MQMGIRDILVVTTPEDEERYRHLLRDGAQWGIHISYCRQPKPEGIAQALLLGRDFINGAPVALILGDNFIYGEGFNQSLTRASTLTSGAINFAYRVSDPERYGIIEFDAQRPSRCAWSRSRRSPNRTGPSSASMSMTSARPSWLPS